MNDDWTKLTSYSVPYMAQLLVSALEANGISAKVFNAHSSMLMPHLSQIIPADVMVKQHDLTAAKELLTEFERTPPKLTESEEE